MKRILIATTIGLAVLTAGCSGTTTPGNPTPAPTTDGGSTPTSESNAASSLAADKLCDLLTEAEVTSIGLTHPGKTKRIGPTDACDWKISGNGGLTVAVRPKSGVKDLNLNGKLSQTKVGKYDATKVEAPDGGKSSCMIVIALSETSSVTVLGALTITSEDTAAACERASKAADLIAPKLP